MFKFQFNVNSFAEKLSQLNGLKTIAMTTNGLTLTRQLVGLQKAGLNLLNISLDTLQSARYQQVTRRKGWERVIAGIDLAIQLGFQPVKVLKNNKGNIHLCFEMYSST